MKENDINSIGRFIFRVMARVAWEGRGAAHHDEAVKNGIGTNGIIRDMQALCWLFVQ